MLFNSTAASFLALLSLSIAASLKHKRITQTGVSLYGYGDDTNGAPIIYIDGTIPQISPLPLGSG